MEFTGSIECYFPTSLNQYSDGDSTLRNYKQEIVNLKFLTSQAKFLNEKSILLLYVVINLRC
jgi:hypothetical protein